MVGVFASLKWRLVTSRLRATHGGARAGIVIGLVVAVAALLVLVAGLVALRSVPDVAVRVVATVYTLQLIAWVLAPMLAFGLDETVDPARFALLPLRPQTLQRGLLVSSLIGALPLANVIVLIGAVIAVSAPWSMLPVALLCAAVQLITCVVLSRAASTSMSSLMSSRRGRDLGMLVGFGLLVVYFVLSFSLSGSDGRGVATGLSSVASWLTWAPPGGLAALPAMLAAGELARAVVAAGTALGVLALGWWWWAAALRRSLTTSTSTTASSSPARVGDRGGAVATDVAGTARLVADRDRLLAWRDPMRRLPWLMVALLIVGYPLLVFDGAARVYAVAFGALLLGTQAANQFGIEGSGLWLHLAVIGDGVRARGEVWGHAALVLVPGTVLVVGGVVLQAVLIDRPDLLPPGLAVSVSALIGGIAVSCYLSARMPYALPQSRKSMFVSSVPGQKGRTLGVTLLTLVGGAVCTAPAVVAAVLGALVDPLWGWVGLLVALGGGAMLLRWAVAATARDYLVRGPEILAVVSAGDRV